MESRGPARKRTPLRGSVKRGGQPLPNELATSSARSPSLFAYEAALVSLNAPVLFSTFSVAAMLDPAAKGGHRSIERHHLFPRGYLEKLSITEVRDVNQIGNYAYVEWRDNVEISDQPPWEYVPALWERFSEKNLAPMYRYHALPDGWEHLDYWEFLGRRRELMAQIVREAYNNLASGPEAAPEPGGIDVEDLVRGGEGDLVELKSTLRVNLHTRQRDSRMELAVLRTLAGFLNRDGGTLIVGVGDDGSPIGLDVDGFENEDRMHQHLVNIVDRSMDALVWAYLHANFDDYEEGRVLVVRCEKAKAPVYVKDGKDQRFYVRQGPSTRELPVGDAHQYISHRFPSFRPN